MQFFNPIKMQVLSIELNKIMFIGEVIVAKIPCLYPGDFRKLIAVDVPQLKSCIRDCIVFPNKGPRPHPNEMSGSDLDGDQYWVSRKYLK